MLGSNNYGKDNNKGRISENGNDLAAKQEATMRRRRQ